MINGKEAMVEEFVLHRIGIGEAPSILSDYSAVLQGLEEQEFLRKLFLKPFSTQAQTNEFTEQVASVDNVLQGLCTDLEKGEDLVGISRSMAQHLIEVADQHDVRTGDFFVARFHGVEMGGAHYDGVGLYKFDDKDVFLESRAEGDKLAMQLKRGLGGRKPDQALLVLFTPSSHTLFVIDDKPQTGFWQRDFIGLQPKKDHVNSTRNLLEMTKTFITEQLPQDYEIPKADQIDLLNRSVQYFKENTEFDRGHFAQEVFQTDAVMDSFQRFGDRFQEDRDVELQDNFAISADAVKRQARVFKSVLKLDKNFHIYIHGDRNKIEQGVDESGRKFYKIYYELEL